MYFVTYYHGGYIVELLEVLDFDGNSTGQVLDKKQIHKLGLYHKEVAIILINNKKEILLQKRASTKEIQPNKWAWHGGHVSVSEDTVDAIIRETNEELGVKLNRNDINFLIKLRRDKMPNKQFTFAYYAFCNYPIEKFNIQKEELSDIKWFSFDKFKEMIFSSHPDMMFKNNQNTKEIINAIEKIINN